MQHHDESVTDTQITVADDSSISANRLFREVPLTDPDGQAKMSVDFYEARLQSTYDGILGTDWLKAVNPDIDWQEGTVALTRNAKRHVNTVELVKGPRKSQRRAAGELSSKAMLKLAREKPREVFCMVIRENPLERIRLNQVRKQSTMTKNRLEAILQAKDHQEEGGESVEPKAESNKEMLFLDQPKTEYEEINTVLQEYQDRFVMEVTPEVVASQQKNVNRKQVMEHTIEHPPDNTKIPNRPYYKMSIRELEELRLQLDKYLRSGMIRPSKSPYGAAVLFAPKKNGKLRFCIDYRPLNEITVKNAVTGASIEDCLNQLHGAKLMSTIDLAQGYHQIPIKEEDKAKTAFNTKYGHYEWNVLPFGLCNAPATFVQSMHHIMTGQQHILGTATARGTFEERYEGLSVEDHAEKSENFLDEFVCMYIDDIIIYSKTVEEHVNHLKKVFERLREYDLYVQSPKTFIARTEVEYLGHLVTTDGIKPLDDKIKTVKEWPQLKTKTDVRQFLGFTGFYRKFVKGFASVAGPLQDLTKDSTQLDEHGNVPWGESQQQSFDALKEALTNAPVLCIPNAARGNFHVMCDASTVGLGATLFQRADDGELHPCAYISRALKPDERNLWKRERTIYNLELKALQYALDKWRIFLEGQRNTTVDTDHKSLIWLKTQTTLNKTQIAFLDTLSRFDLEIKYIKGELNIPGDAPSRRPDISKQRWNRIEKKRRNTKRLPRV